MSTPGRNRLDRETSPYLLQHKDNPVHWWAWGPEALAEAKRTAKPILLSVGYAACHWCHVMAHESFESETTAALMNELFVNIKVDREERPDIDAIYMDALHKLGEHGGWPLTMFLDIEARPFWGGTYFPPDSRYGKPSFTRVLNEIARIFRDEPDKVATNADGLTAMLRRQPEAGVTIRVDDDMIAGLVARIAEAVDDEHGGLRGAPKFPQWSIFWLLWRGAIRYRSEPAKQAVITTLTNICQGGIYDHLGGGFSRYSVDERWLVPHFEKMLYDNALLLDLLTEAWRETRNPLFAQRIEETVGWLAREMICADAQGKTGGLAASLDADSEGEEGKFYVWSRSEVLDVMGKDDGEFFCQVYDVTEAGNFEGHNILNRLGSQELMSSDQEARLASLRAKLFARREPRIRPGWDDKVLADWSGLMIAALTNAARVFERPDWLALATNAYDFVRKNMMRDGRLLHAYRAGQAKAPATASDYADMTWAALRLYAVTSDTAYLDHARDWTATLDRHYLHEAGGYCMAADDTPDVIARLRVASDDAVPNANGIMISNLVQLFLATGETAYLDSAEKIPQAFAADLHRNLVSHCGLLAGTLDLISPQHVVISSPLAGEVARSAGGGDLVSSQTTGNPPTPNPSPQGGGELAQALHAQSLPGALEQITAGLPGKPPVDGAAAAYLCLGTQCSPPIRDAEILRRKLAATRAVRP